MFITILTQNEHDIFFTISILINKTQYGLGLNCLNKIKMINREMIAEKIILSEQNSSTLAETEIKPEKLSGVVDINHLLARVRKEEKKESKINMVFFGLFAALILIVGFLLSL